MMPARRPAVRQVYADDPDGGVFDGVPDRWAGQETALAEFEMAEA